MKDVKEQIILEYLEKNSGKIQLDSECPGGIRKENGDCLYEVDENNKIIHLEDVELQEGENDNSNTLVIVGWTFITVATLAIIGMVVVVKMQRKK
jgi:hypothetical protein